MTQETQRQTLRSMPLFAGMNPKTVERLETAVFQRAIDQRQVLYFPGDPGDSIYWICTGQVRLMRPVHEKREFSFRHLVNGDVFGEEAVFNEAPRREYAEAMVPTSLLVLSTDVLRKAAQADKELLWRLATHTTERLGQTEDRLVEMAFTSVRRRIARAIMRAYEREPGGKKRELIMTHQELASLIGSTRETTTSILQSFRNASMIALSNRCVRVLEPSSLAKFAAGED
jgi:CRP/FNR family transcriptional regulator, cyclic AMP receptor protein